MRHYMVDPDNEERLLKIPHYVVDRIKADVLREALAAVEALREPWPTSAPDALPRSMVIAAITALLDGER